MRIASMSASAVVLALLVTVSSITPSSAMPTTSALTCTLTVHQPHPSIHVGGTINVEATTTCPIAMGSIYVDTELNRVSGTYKTWTGPPKTNYGKRTLTSNAAAPCSAGPRTFNGWAITRITPPPGYVLTGPGQQMKYGPNIAVACGAGASKADVPLTIGTLTFEELRPPAAR